MRFRSAETLEEALATLAESGDETQVLAGGTDVMVQHQHGEISPEALLHIERIESLRSIGAVNGQVRLGALVTHRMVSRDPAIVSGLPALAQASATVGGWQTQEVGTVVGNVVNASPAADTVPSLLNAGCVVELASAGGSREEALEAFLLGRRQTSRRPDELVTGLRLDPAGSRTGEVYLKVGPRSAMEVALVGLAVRLSLEPDGETVADARVAVCAVAPVPYRVTAAEEILTGSRLEAATVDEAGLALSGSASPIDDPRASAAYRKRVLAPLLGRAVERARQNALEAM